MGGDVEVYDRMEAREICLQMLKDMIKNLGYSEVGALIYCLSNDGLKLLQSDMDVITILNEDNPGNMLEFWVETMDEVDLVDADMEVLETESDWENAIEVECLKVEEQVGEQQKVAEKQKAANAEARAVDDAFVENRKTKKVKTNDEVEIKFSDEESIVDSDSDVEGKWPIFRAATDMKDPQFRLGMTFASKQQFREAVQNYAFNNGKEIKTLKNDKERVIVKCTQEGCPWRIGLRKVLGSMTWRILNMTDEHEDCSWVWENGMVKSSVVAKRWLTELQDHPDWMMRKFKDKVCSQEGFYVSNSQAYRAIWKAKKLRQGKVEDTFKKIWSYKAEIERTNPKTTCPVKLSDLTDESGNSRFLRMYVCWEASKQGFKHCRRIIGLDGCHLRTETGGMLLTAVSIDGNDSIFPLAYAIVEGEKKESWTWFLQLLKTDLEITRGVEDEYCFISDKQKGLIPAFESELPGVENRFCVRHLHANMKVAGFQGKALKDCLWACARATTLNAFNVELSKLRGLDEDAYQWLGDKSPTEWSRSHFSTQSHCDMLVNNICESWNGSIRDARDKPIIECLEILRKMLMGKFFEKRQKAAEWKALLCPAIVRKLKKIEKDASTYHATQCDFHKFEVSHLYGDQQEVDLEAKKCSCRVWDLTGIPCKHAICAIWKKHGKGSVTDYVHPCYSKETYLKVYGGCINPMTGPNDWPQCDRTPPLPPLYTAKVGRPKKQRARSAAELTIDGKYVSRQHIQLHCGLCRQPGHNARKCPTNPNKKLKPKKRFIYSARQIPIHLPSGHNQPHEGVAETEDHFPSGDQQQQELDDLPAAQQLDEQDQSQSKDSKGKRKLRPSNRKKPYYTRSKTTFKSKFFGNKGEPIDLE
ncbi:PREDICTED: uncharacterized protein LOC109192856 [Ipomoea nil]|uniref:uncharacterized protein LOC109192856 n=1 Tax=Ipomoea nil TaxID=35883 RepID=UPI000900DB08|nr:PREDICTED: uncharacterized protein LOC109192856 [Ipomoea nil]